MAYCLRWGGKLTKDASERLDGWKQIAEYLKRDVTTVIRWEREKGLPVQRIPGGKRQAVFAYREDIDGWLLAPSTSRSPTLTAYDLQDLPAIANTAQVTDPVFFCEGLGTCGNPAEIYPTSTEAISQAV